MNSSKSHKKSPIITDIVTVNDKGQVVIPASARNIVGLDSGDKLLVMIHPSHAGIILMKPDGLESYATHILEKVNIAKTKHAN